MSFFAQGTSSSVCDNITFQNTTISNNTQKGLYFEKLSNSLLKNLIMDNNGTDPLYGFNNGIDINLKYGSYSNITIQDCEITNSGYVGTSTDPLNAAVVTIKARDDSPSYNTIPATLTNVVVKNNLITGPQNGLRFGEYNKINSTPTNVTVEGNDLSYAFSNKAIINRMNADVIAICNWHGSTDLSTILATLAEYGTGNIILSTSLATGGDGSLAVGFQPTGSCTCPSGNLVTNTNTSETFCSIQAAIDDPQTLNGHTLSVGPGTYIENIVVTKELTIAGPNAGISPNTGVRLPEALLIPALNSPTDWTSSLIEVIPGNVVIDGLTLDGDNPSLGGSGDYNVSQGIIAMRGQANVIVKNNIIRNIATVAIILANDLNGAMSTGNIVTENKIDNVSPTSGFGIGVYTGNNTFI
ncbi:MAG: hypothetical protein IPH88_05775 [Bacteroidales bacterium]|nr:hypothetical protein [Bacteroidales bacterium]